MALPAPAPRSGASPVNHRTAPELGMVSLLPCRPFRGHRRGTSRAGRRGPQGYIPPGRRRIAAGPGLVPTTQPTVPLVDRRISGAVCAPRARDAEQRSLGSEGREYFQAGAAQGSMTGVRTVMPSDVKARWWMVLGVVSSGGTGSLEESPVDHTGHRVRGDRTDLLFETGSPNHRKS